jgi:hypothetical protein
VLVGHAEPALAADSVQFVNKHDGRSGLRSLCEELAASSLAQQTSQQTLVETAKKGTPASPV